MDCNWYSDKKGKTETAGPVLVRFGSVGSWFFFQSIGLYLKTLMAKVGY
jgi:hypothetical protein